MITQSTLPLRMNFSHKSNMGTIFSIFANNDDENHDKDDNVYPQASPEIKVLVIYEQPQGTGLHMTLTFDPTMITSSFKNDLTNLINVPQESIILIHHNITLEDEKSLIGQGVQPHDTIVLRDSRLTYTFP